MSKPIFVVLVSKNLIWVIKRTKVKLPEIKIRHNKHMFTSHLLLFAAVAKITKFHKAVMVLCHWAIVIFLTLGGLQPNSTTFTDFHCSITNSFFIASG